MITIINYFFDCIPEHTCFQVNGKFTEKIFLNDTDLCVVLSNLLRNAVEAQNNLQTSAAAKIQISLYENREYILIRIKNTSNPILIGTPANLPTSKNDVHNHGFGIQNVQKVVNKYDGKLDLRYDNEIFTASAYLRNV